MRSKYMLSCAVAALVGGNATAAIAADAAPGSTGIETVIVTVERRDQSIQNVPSTVQAFTGSALTELNITTFDDLLRYTPNVTFGNNGPGQGEIIMRGLSNGYRGNQSSGTIANFPNVAIYLDDQSMQFPARNLDIYMVDMNRVEVLEGPQGTLFGGGAEAGAIRYITNKPKLDAFEGNAQASYGFTSGGADSSSANLTLNVPIIKDKLAVRGVIYNERQGGYIDNVPSTFTRSNNDFGNFYFNIAPNGSGICPNGQPAGSAGLCTLANAPQLNNYNNAKNDFNPVNLSGGRLEALYQIDEDWDVLITESLQNIDAEGISAQFPTGSDFQQLQPLQVTVFNPSYNKDHAENTAWTVNGKIGDLSAVYTGGYTVRQINEQMDYVNYSRTGPGMYYQCTGGSTGWGTAAPVCFSPNAYWQDWIRSTHFSNEARVSSPDDWRLRFIAGVYEEQFKIFDDMNFSYTTIPDCNPLNLSIAQAGGQVCVATVSTAPGADVSHPGARPAGVSFGEDTKRGYDQWAGFASVDYDIIPDVLTVTAGTRWYQYHEYQRGAVYQTGVSADCLNAPDGSCISHGTNMDAEHLVKNYAGFKSRANITWHINPDMMVYATWSQGFRPGGFNRRSKAVAPGADGNNQFQQPLSYAPDTLTNTEIGAKTSLFDNRLQLNLSAYYMIWQNVQFNFFNPQYLGNITFALNGPNYDVKGVEAQFVSRLADGLTLQGSGAYNENTVANSRCLVDNIPGTAAFGQCISEIISKTSHVLTPFANPYGVPGSVAAFSPKFQGNMHLRYDWTVDNYNPYAMVGVSYTGSMFNQPSTYKSGDGVLIPDTTFLRYLQPAFTTFDASIGVNLDKYYVEIYGQNLGNSHASTFTSSAQFIKSEVPLRPRVIGLKVGAAF